MAFNITAQINVNWVPEGAGSNSVPSAQTLELDVGYGALQSPIGISGATTGAALTAAEVNAACTTLGSLAASYFGTTALSTLQGWPAGNP